MHCRTTPFRLSLSVLLQALLLMDVVTSRFSEFARPLSEVKPANPDEYLQAYNEATRRIFILDDGGTLRDSSRDNPGQKEASIKVLKKLSGNKNNVVWIDTAHSSAKAKQWYNIKDLGIAGSLGSDPILPGSEEARIASFKELQEHLPELKEAVFALPVLKDWKSTTSANLPTSIIIHFDQDKEKYGLIVAEIKEILKQDPFKEYRITQPYAEKQFISISHKDAHKGTLVNWLLKHYKADPQHTFVLTIGDQNVDEEMHKIMQSKGYYSITTSQDRNHQTYARNRLEDPGQVLQLLNKLADSD